MRAYIEQNFIEVYDEELDDWRLATPNDSYPYNDSAGAPDLSLMAKARAGFSGPYGLGLNQLFRGIGGPEYIASLLTHYTGEGQEQFGAYFYGNENLRRRLDRNGPAALRGCRGIRRWHPGPPRNRWPWTSRPS